MLGSGIMSEDILPLAAGYDLALLQGNSPVGSFR